MATRTEVLQRAAALMVKLTKEQQIERGLLASGKTADSLVTRVGPDRVEMLGDLAFLAQERGRKPGKAPPTDVIIQWIRDKNLIFDISINSLAYLIGRKIARRGTDVFMKKRPGMDFAVILAEWQRQIFKQLENAEFDELERQVNETIKK